MCNLCLGVSFQMAKDKKRSKQKEQRHEEVAMDEEIVHKEERTISTKRKKKKKELVTEENEQNDITEGEEKRENGEKKKKRKKKSSGISVLAGEHIKATESIEASMKTEISDEQHAATETKTKKKKKKLQQLEDIKSEEVVAVVCEGGKKKRTGQSLPAGHDGDISGLDFGEEASVATPKKIKKKKKKKQFDEENRDVEENGTENSADTTENIPVEGETKQKKRKKAADAEETCVQFEQATQEKQEKKKKKPKRKQVIVEEDASTSNIKQTEQKKGKRKKTDSSHVEDMTHTTAGADLGILEEKNTEGKAKKSKKQKAISVNTEMPELNHKHTEGEKKKQKKKKAKKEHKEESAQQPLIEEKDEGETTGTGAVNGKKRKKTQKDLSEACTVANTPMLKKKKKLSEESAPAKPVKQEERQRTVSGEEHQEVSMTWQIPANQMVNTVDNMNAGRVYQLGLIF